MHAHQATLAARSAQECADILACAGELDVAAKAATDTAGAAPPANAGSAVRALAAPPLLLGWFKIHQIPQCSIYTPAHSAAQQGHSPHQVCAAWRWY